MDDSLSPRGDGSGEVTLVVASRDRWGDLRATLPRHEAPVILVDNGSTDGTPDLVREHFPEVRVIELGRNAGATARNIGVSAAPTPYVAFADDDSWWSAGSLELAVDVMRDHARLGLLAGRVLVGNEERLDPTCAAMATSPLGRRPDLPGPSVLGFVACAAVVRKTAFERAGGFDEIVFFMGEEERLCLDLAALGWDMVYVEEAVVHHHPSASRDPREREVRLARNRLLTAVLRRPWLVVLTTAARTGASGAAGRAALRSAAAALPRALRARRPAPRQVEELRQRLDGTRPVRGHTAAH